MSHWRTICTTTDHILIPVEQFVMLVTRKVSDDSERSILTYVPENNIAVQQGGELTISPCEWCAGVGSNGTDRMVAEDGSLEAGITPVQKKQLEKDSLDGADAAGRKSRPAVKTEGEPLARKLQNN